MKVGRKVEDRERGRVGRERDREVLREEKQRY